MDAHLTPVAQRIPDHELAVAVARQRLLSQLSAHPVAPLEDLLCVGRAIGLSMYEMQRLTGIARQTLYRRLERQNRHGRRPAGPQAKIEVLVLLAREGKDVFASPSELASRAGIDPTGVMGAITDLDADRLCEVRRDAYGSPEAALTEKGALALREHFDELFLRQPDGISVYLRVVEEERAAIAGAASRILQRHDHALLPQSVAPSLMTGPELGLTINAPTIRRALVIASEIWGELRRDAGLREREPAVANIIPPGGQYFVASDVLDAYVESVVDAGAHDGEALRELRSRFGGGVSEHELAGRCVTAAALALRRVAGHDEAPRPVLNGDAAFAELERAQDAPVPPQAAAIRDSALAALMFAADHLGPFPGGRLGSFRHPDRPPRIVETVRPSGDQLLEMARLSGQAVGAAAGLRALDPGEALTMVISGAWS